MPDRIPRHVTAQRMALLSALERELRSEYFRSLTGMRLRVLVESLCDDESEMFAGTSCRYAPVLVPTSQAHAGRLLDVIAEDVRNGHIYGRPICGEPR